MKGNGHCACRFETGGGGYLGAYLLECLLNVVGFSGKCSREIIGLLRPNGGKIRGVGRHVRRFLRVRQDFDLESVTLSNETLAAMDCVRPAAGHERFDLDFIKATRDSWSIREAAVSSRLNTLSKAEPAIPLPSENGPFP